MNFTYFHTTNEDLESNMNVAKEVLLNVLEQEKLLVEGTTAKDIGEKYAIVLHKKGRFGAWIDKVLGITDEKAMYFRVVKIV